MTENDPLETGDVPTTSRSSRVIAWACMAVACFAFGSLATYVSLMQRPLMSTFEGSAEWMIASVAFAAFSLGVGVAYFPYAWYRDDANRIVAERPVLYSRKSALSRRRAWRRRH